MQKGSKLSNETIEKLQREMAKQMDSVVKSMTTPPKEYYEVTPKEVACRALSACRNFRDLNSRLPKKVSNQLNEQMQKSLQNSDCFKDTIEEVSDDGQNSVVR